MADRIEIIYRFQLDNGETREIPVALARNDLSFLPDALPDPPAWAELMENRCAQCGIDPETSRFCPVALNLSGIAAAFRDFYAYENAAVEVITAERIFMKRTTIQEGLGALIGIVMATSGCPTLDFLRPLARFHLPFASMQETFFRAVSAYLLSRYLRQREGRGAELEISGLAERYAAINAVNGDFARRLQNAADKDANANALVNLDCFAAMLPFALEDLLAELTPYFSAYLSADGH